MPAAAAGSGGRQQRQRAQQHSGSALSPALLPAAVVGCRKPNAKLRSQNMMALMPVHLQSTRREVYQARPLERDVDSTACCVHKALAGAAARVPRCIRSAVPAGELAWPCRAGAVRTQACACNNANKPRPPPRSLLQHGNHSCDHQHGGVGLGEHGAPRLQWGRCRAARGVQGGERPGWGQSGGLGATAMPPHVGASMREPSPWMRPLAAAAAACSQLVGGAGGAAVGAGDRGMSGRTHVAHAGLARQLGRLLDVGKLWIGRVCVVQCSSSWRRPARQAAQKKGLPVGMLLHSYQQSMHRLGPPSPAPRLLQSCRCPAACAAPAGRGPGGRCRRGREAGKTGGRAQRMPCAHSRPGCCSVPGVAAAHAVAWSAAEPAQPGNVLAQR